MLQESEQTSPSAPVSPVSPLFCDGDADITFQSSDGVLFKIYQTHLQTASAGFSIPDSTVVDAAPISLEEPSSVLEILFKFIHPCTESTQFHQPPVKSLEPELFFAVAEAAEKYIVYGAMNTFLTCMVFQLVDARPIEVLNHAYKHGYPDLADSAAYSSLAQPLKDITRGLTHPGLLQKWLTYYDLFREVVRSVEGLLAPGFARNCPRVVKAYAYYSRAVNSDVRTASSIVDGSGCNVQCQCRYESDPQYYTKEASKVAKQKLAAIPKFSQVTI